MTTAAVFSNSDSMAMKEKLLAIPEPANDILCRLQAMFSVVQEAASKPEMSYSRMHNRHNRS